MSRPQFGFQTSTATNAFGAQPAQGTAANTSLFNASGFNAATPNVGPAGTPIKFTSTSGTDTMIKNGASMSINTRHQCITFMPEYQNKSFEELRYEDYAANRKGPTNAQASFGATNQPQNIFNAQPQSSTGFSFGNTAAQKPLFGASQTTTSFGAQPTTNLFGAQPAQQPGVSLFNKPTGFGAPATSSTSSFGFGATQNPFNSSLQTKNVFGTATNTNLFGTPASTTTSTFGTSNAFSGTTGFGATANPFGAKPTGFGTPVAATTSATSGGFSFGNPTQSTGLFGARPAATGFGTTGFGATNTGFAAPQTTGSNLFAQTKPNAFGTSFGTTQFGGGGGFGTSMPFGTTNTAGTSMFSNPAASKPSPFSFNNPSGMNLLNPTIGGNPANDAYQNQIQQQIAAISAAPFGDSPLFRNLLKEDEDRIRPTDPIAHKVFLNSKVKMPHLAPYQPIVKFKPIPKVSLFEGIKEDSQSPEKSFSPRTSIKKLDLTNINKTSSNTSFFEDHTEFIESGIGHPKNDGAGDLSIIMAHKNSPINQKEKFFLNDTIQELNIKQNVDKSSSQDTQPKDTIKSSPPSYEDQTNDEDDELEAESNTPPHPAGIILKRHGYYTIPSLEQLAEMTDKDGNCYVDSFCIGRQAYGNVVYVERLNVANLNLDEIVHFRRREITLYPDDEKKPPLGRELNRRAQVTLDCVWPLDKSTHQPIKDIDRLEAMNYQEKLERATLKLGARFIEYRPETGSWVFAVKHFSKYGYVDSDEEEDLENMVLLKAKPSASQPRITAPPQQSLETNQTSNQLDRIQCSS